jgi:hypothetical protein
MKKWHWKNDLGVTTSNLTRTAAASPALSTAVATDAEYGSKRT